MAERPEEHRLSSPIVPDVNTSLTANHLRHHRPARLWPLWFVILLLLLAIGGVSALAWQERMALHQAQERLEGQLSNVHARFDGFGEGQQEELEPITERLDVLDSAQRALRDRLEEQEGLLESVRLTSADGEALSDLVARFDDTREDVEALESLIVVVRQSLDALEESGAQSRAMLTGRLGRIEERLDEQQPNLDEMASRWEEVEPRLTALDESRRSLEERFDAIPDVDPQRLDEIAAELNRLEDSLVALQGVRDDDQEALAGMRDRLGATQAELTELRQSQLATSAQLEALQSQLGN